MHTLTNRAVRWCVVVPQMLVDKKANTVLSHQLDDALGAVAAGFVDIAPIDGDNRDHQLGWLLWYTMRCDL